MNTTYFLNLVMGNLFHTKETPAIPGQYYIGLSTTAPSIDGSNVTEPSTNGTGYYRVAMTGLSTPVNGVITNVASFNFSESTKSWGTISHYVVYDAATGGNLLFYGKLNNNLTIDAGSAVTLRADELSITLGNP